MHRSPDFAPFRSPSVRKCFPGRCRFAPRQVRPSSSVRNEMTTGKSAVVPGNRQMRRGTITATGYIYILRIIRGNNTKTSRTYRSLLANTGRASASYHYRRCYLQRARVMVLLFDRRARNIFGCETFVTAQRALYA